MALSASESAGMVSIGSGASANCNAPPSRTKSTRPRSAMSCSAPTIAASTTFDATTGPF